MDLKKKLGKRIKELRLQRNLPQEYVANILSINVSNYSRIETGLSYPKPENLEKICQTFKVLPKDLFDFEHHKQINEIKTELNELIKSDDKLAVMLYKFAQIV